jgi:GT2 family glycosyltransferase
MSLSLPVVEQPDLSVVMVTHGAWRLIDRAIRELVEHTERSFELIVVDNDSDNETRAQLSQLSGVRVILNQENRGFGPAANQGAEQARGEYLVLLNSDAFVHAGWLEPLLEALARPKVGAVVPRYLNPDGSLQEAGVLLARDGSVQLYGEGDDPDRGCYCFSRRVDYGSAICMAMRLAAFTALGGFDPAYAPAYYEDSDLCLRLATHGMAVLYEPRTSVTHVRYGSGDIASAVELSQRNRKLFAERWSAQLFGRPPTFEHASEQAAIAARDTLSSPRILICSSAGEPTAEALAEVLLTGWPQSRLTWAIVPGSVDRFDRGFWLARGVELLDEADPSWLSSRLFHYDVAILSPQTGDQLQVAIARSQPQATQISLEALEGPPDTLRARVVPLLAEAGIAPPGA